MQGIAQPLVKGFSYLKLLLEMENKGLVEEFRINLSSWDHDYWLNQPVSCSDDRVGNKLNRQDISNSHNSDFRSRFQNDSNMQMRLGKENSMESLSGRGP